MTNILYYSYYYRYGEHRKQVNNLLNADNLVEAKNKLDVSIAEHNIKYPIQFLENRHDFNYGEYVTMEHAKRHLDMVVVDGDIPFIGRDGEVWSQKRKIIEILDHMPTNSDL
jgi:hypothetical protein